MNKFYRVLDIAGLGTAIAVQMAVMTVSMIRLSPGPLETIGFIISGIAIVLFAPRAFSKWTHTKKPRYLINYIMLELVTLFFGWSFVVSGTVAQTQSFEIVVSIDNDTVLQEFYDQRERAQGLLQDKREEFDQSVRAETIQNIQVEQQALQSEIRDLNTLIQSRLLTIASGEATQTARNIAGARSADVVFSAIPVAVEEGRHLQVIIWFLFVGSISLMIINSLTDEAHKSKEKNVKKNFENFEELDPALNSAENYDSIIGEENIPMPGFFEIEKDITPTVQKPTRLSGCESCKAYELCNTPKFTYRGQGNRNILFVFDHVTRREDRTGEPFQNLEHQYLFSILDKYGLRAEDIWTTHAVQCYQPSLEGKDIQVSSQSIAGCHSRLIATINKLKPEKIFVLGPIAMKTLYHTSNSGRFSFAKYDRFPGSIIPDQNLKTLVIPVLNPSDAMKELERRKKLIKVYRPDSRFNKILWEDDYLKNTDTFRVVDSFIRKQIQAGLRAKYETFDTPNVEIITDSDRLREVLRHLSNAKAFSFDIETTGLKPFASGHEIYTWAFSDGANTWAFRHPDDVRSLRMLKRALTSPAQKYGWNIQYEHIWIKHLLQYDITNWAWDGVIGTHVIDNREGITSLKFQTFAQCGIVGYDDEIDKFLRSADAGNDFNSIKQADLPRLLEYNGFDAYFTFIIAERQMQKVLTDESLRHGYKLLHEGQLSLAKMTLRGFRVDTVALQKNYIELDKKAMALYDKIKKADEVKDWPDFNPASNTHLTELFYDRLKFPVVDTTKGGQPSTKSDVLEGFYTVHGCGIAQDIADYKTAVQTRDTFLEGIRKETYDNEIHPLFSLNLVASYRSSSQKPNFQNYPKRDKYAMEKIRTVFVPRPGFVFLEADYVSLEGFMGCNYHKDAMMQTYLLDENTDMHGDMAQDIFKLERKDVDPDLFSRMRAVGKTANFALQYGSSARMLAYNLWNGHMNSDLKNKMKETGVDSYDLWDRHIREIYRIYWEERFSDLNEWRSRVWENYIKTGKVISKMGLLYTNVMTQNQVGNYPIQGSGFNVLLEGVNSMTKEMEEAQMLSGFISEIHDSVILEVHENEIDDVKEMLSQHCIINIKEHHKWIEMPLRMKGETYSRNWSEADADSEFDVSA